jgi:hypothetical protein
MCFDPMFIIIVNFQLWSIVNFMNLSMVYFWNIARMNGCFDNLFSMGFIQMNTSNKVIIFQVFMLKFFCNKNLLGEQIHP